MVDFWAPWCGPVQSHCTDHRGIGKTYGDQMTFAKVNVDENPLSPSKYGVQAIPTLIFSKTVKSPTRSPVWSPRTNWNKPLKTFCKEITACQRSIMTW